MTDANVIDLCADISKQLSEFSGCIDQNIHDQQRIVLFLGVTGSGKSTLVALLTGKELTVKKGGADECELVCPGFGIAGGAESVTKSPIIHKISESVSICDCPGFEDTEGESEEILHAYQMFKLFGKENGKKLKIKIIFVISHSELRSERGARVNDMMKRIRQMFSNDSSIDSCLRLAITGCGCLDLDKNRYDAPLLKQFREDNIFLFPEPEMKDVGKVYDTAKTHLYGLDSFVRSDSGFLDDPRIKVSLNPESELLLKKAEDKEAKKITGMLERMFRSFLCACKEECRIVAAISLPRGVEFLKKQLEEVKDWKENDDGFLTFLSEHCSLITIEDSGVSQVETLKLITFISSFAQFIDVVLGSKKIADDFKETKNKGCEHLIEVLGCAIAAAESYCPRDKAESYKESRMKGEQSEGTKKKKGIFDKVFDKVLDAISYVFEIGIYLLAKKLGK